MKKNVVLIAAAAALALLAGCSREDVEPAVVQDTDAISFSAYTGTAVTKGVAVGNSEIIGSAGSEAKGIGVFAFYQPAVAGVSVNFNTRKFATPDFMYNQQVSSSDGGSTWTYTPTKYWPNNSGDMLSFFAYAPYEEGTTWDDLGIATDATASKITASFPIYNEKAAMEDILWTDPQLNKTKASTAAGATDNPIVFNFRHILSKVAIQVGVESDKAAGQAGAWDYEKTDITINSIEFKGLAESYNFSCPITGGAMGAGTWTATGSQDIKLTEDDFQNYVITADNHGATDGGVWNTTYWDNLGTTPTYYKTLLADEGTSPNTENAFLFFAPQAFTSGADDLVITYTVLTKENWSSSTLGANDSKIVNTIECSLADILPSSSFESGSAYTLKFLLGMNSVKFSVELSDWETPTEHQVDAPLNDDTAATSVYDIDGANKFVSENSTAKEISVTFSREPNDSGIPGEDEGAHALLTTLLSENSVLNVTVETDTKTLYVGDYPDQNTVTKLTDEETYAAVVNLTIPSGKQIGTLIINAPSKSVHLNGQKVTSVGTLDNVEATTSAYTLVVEQGQKIDTLKVHQGGLEIHENTSADVTALVIEEDAHDSNPVKVRACEYLSQSVFDVIYKVGEHDYIDRPVWVEKRNTTDTTAWDIVKSVCFTGTVANPIGGYATLEDAFAAVETGGTVTLLEDITTTSEILVDKKVTLNLNGYSINSGTHSAFQINGGSLNISGEGTISGDPANHKEIWLKGSTDASASSYSVLSVGAGAKVSCSTGYAIMVSQNEGVAYGTMVAIYGEAEGYYGALYVNGTIQATSGNVPTIYVYGKLTTTEESAALYAAGYAKYYIMGSASLTGNNAAYISSGVVTIYGGTFTATGAASQYVAAPSGYNTTGDAIVIDTRDGYAAHSVTIKGGFFSSENNKAIGVYPAGAADKGFISGGYFSTALADSLVADTYEVVDNTDNATKDKYPYVVNFKLSGSGTVDDPYQVGSAEDLKLLGSVGASGYYSNYLLTQDVVTTGEEFTVSGDYFGKTLTKYICGSFDGGGHTIKFPEGASSYAICDCLYGGTIKNLNVEFPEEGTVAYWTYTGARFENVDVSGKLLHFNGNCGAYCVYDFKDATFIDCDCSADITGEGGSGDYNAVFIGYTLSNGKALTFQNCTYSGKMVCGKSAMFVGNPCCRNITMNVENCTNAGTIISTYVASGYKMNYYAAISDHDSSNNYDSFVLNGTSHPGVSADNSWIPLCWEDNLVTTTGQAINGPEQTGMVFQRGGDNQFVITPATGGMIGSTTVHHYVVSTGLYVGIQGQSGSGRQYATETITPDGSASYTTTMKDLQFVDRTYVGSGEIVVEGANNTYTDANGTYYVIASGYTTGGNQPESATLYNLSAFDENGVLLATANLTE